MTKKDRWILSEYLVALDREARFPEKLIAHRLRSPYSEIDLLFETQDGSRPYILMEVKSVSSDLWGHPPLTRLQRVRLERARFWLEARSKRSVQLILACVNKQGAITYFPAPF